MMALHNLVPDPSPILGVDHFSRALLGHPCRAPNKRTGLVGGKARARALTKEQRPEIARKPTAARWGKKQ
jgi:hypothetical protein